MDSNFATFLSLCANNRKNMSICPHSVWFHLRYSYLVSLFLSITFSHQNYQYYSLENRPCRLFCMIFNRQKFQFPNIIMYKAKQLFSVRNLNSIAIIVVDYLCHLHKRDVYFCSAENRINNTGDTSQLFDLFHNKHS